MGKCDELKFCKKKRSGSNESIDNNILSIYTEKIFVIYIFTFVHYLYWIEKEFINERQTAIVVYYL